MLFAGNFTLISPAGLLQLLCQERRSVTITAWYGSSAAQVTIAGGKVVAARCGNLHGADAIYQLMSWGCGQFKLESYTPSADDCALADWEELLLEAARRRDEGEQAALALPAGPNRAVLASLLVACPAIAGAATVGYDGRVLSSVALGKPLAANVAALAGSLALTRESLGGTGAIAIYIGGGHKLLLAEWNQQIRVLAAALPGAPVGEAVGQVARWLVRVRQSAPLPVG